MDINTFRGIATITVMIAFFAVCWWAFSPRRRKRFDDAANLPFADDEKSQSSSREPRHDDTTEDPTTDDESVDKRERE